MLFELMLLDTRVKPAVFPLINFEGMFTQYCVSAYQLPFFPALDTGASKDLDFFATVAGTTMTRNVPQQ